MIIAEYLPGIWYGDEEDRIKLEKNDTEGT